MQHTLEIQQVLICYADPDPADFLDQARSNLDTSDTQRVLLLKSIGKQYAQTKSESQELNIIKNEAQTPT